MNVTKNTVVVFNVNTGVFMERSHILKNNVVSKHLTGQRALLTTLRVAHNFKFTNEACLDY